MLIPLLKAMGIDLLVMIGLGGLVLLVMLVSALAEMGWVAVVQWRDILSIDRWAEVLDTIRRSKLRTALTMISVAWGIFVLVFLLGLGQGLDNGLHEQFARDAMNGIWITANKTSIAHEGYDVGRKITFENRDYDRAASAKLPGPGAQGIEHISGQYFIRGGRFGGGEMLTKRNGKANSFQINAVHPDAMYLAAHIVESGRFLDLVDIVQRRKSAVIGRPVQNFLFGSENPIGQWINVAGVPFQVVGVFSDPGGAEQERQIYIPVSTAQLAFNGVDHLGMLEFTVGNASAEQAKIITDQVVAQLAERHQFDPKDPQAIRVQNNVENFERFGKLFWMISTFVIVIGMGTLAAGVVGVSNIMMIAVKERTKEIGVRKALGATPTSIVFMIIQEAVFLTGIAGLLGLSAGIALLEVTGRIVESDFIKNPSINLAVGIAATLGLVTAGALAGYFPARAAARVNPIHALRDQ
ncbi:MAG TPA: ABC transporter permease [Kofleriaceae bacterium]|jgi:putative ABC transport system permease protein|nr:ABC transporter permease [Kofleriaceae bacterium]